MKQVNKLFSQSKFIPRLFIIGVFMIGFPSWSGASNDELESLMILFLSFEDKAETIIEEWEERLIEEMEDNYRGEDLPEEVREEVNSLLRSHLLSLMIRALVAPESDFSETAYRNDLQAALYSLAKQLRHHKDLQIPVFTIDEDEQLDSFLKRVIEKRKIMEWERDQFLRKSGDRLFRDRDWDEVSDFDEAFVFNSRVGDSNTAGLQLTDGELITKGLDPTDPATPTIELPTDPEDLVSEKSNNDLFIFKDTTLIKDREGQEEALELTGRYLPNGRFWLFLLEAEGELLSYPIETDRLGYWRIELPINIVREEATLFSAATISSAGAMLAGSGFQRLVHQDGQFSIEPNIDIKEIEEETAAAPGLITTNNIVQWLIILLVSGSVVVVVIWWRQRSRLESEEVYRSE